MKKETTIIILIFLLILFGIFEYYKNSGNVVLKIVTSTKIIVDLNRNKIFDEGELICIPELTTLSANIPEASDLIIDEHNLSHIDSIKIGYLADEFSKNALENKKVRLKYKKNNSSECKFADIYVNRENYSDLLIKEGFAIKNGKLLNSEEFLKKLEFAQKLNLVLLNTKSGKYHDFNCKYGKHSSEFVILSMQDAEKAYEKCNYCLKTRPINKQKPTINKKERSLYSYSTSINESYKNEDITFLLSDYTKISAPSRECQHDFCKEFVNIINSTQRTLDIAAYGWAEIPEITQALNKAKARGVNIRVVYDKRNGKEYYPETRKFVNSFENTKSDENQVNKKLTSMLMHNKFIISDNETVYTGSMNFSTTGFSGFNANNVVIIKSPELANLYTAEFNQMFSGKFHTEKMANNANRTIKIKNTEISVYFSPQDKIITKRVIPLINNAKKYIYIPAYVITHNELSNALINARTRGVNIKIIADATSSGSTHSKNKILRENGISLKYENFAGKIHNKSIIIDDEIVITGSMNFSNSGENKNDENCLIIENKEIAKFYREYFEYLWAKIPDKWLYNTVRAESKDSINSCDDGIDNDYDGKTDIDDSGCF